MDCIDEDCAKITKHRQISNSNLSNIAKNICLNVYLSL